MFVEPTILFFFKEQPDTNMENDSQGLQQKHILRLRRYSVGKVCG